MKHRSLALVSRRQAESLLEALHFSAAAIPNVQALDEALESILSELTEKLNFEFAAISLVDEYRDCIETVRGRNISPGWIMRAKHQLDVRDIQTYIVGTGATKVIVESDDLLDKDIYERFEHWRLARVWAPILSSDQRVVGTIEAGCDKQRRDDVLTNSAIERVKQLGREKGEEIARTRPHVLLEVIANRAIELIDADSATLHVYRRNVPDSSVGEGPEWGELILAAGAGKATPEFVQSDQPRQGGRGREAIRTGKPQCVNDPRRFKADYPELHKCGVRALAVVPLNLGQDAEGVLGFHFWRRGKRFTSRELNLAEMFAHQMEGVIQNYLLLRRATEAGSRAWALSGLQSLMHSLTSPFNLPEVLKKIAKNALLTLDADNVAVYQYHADKNDFYVPPVLDGQFIDPAAIKMDLSPDDTPFEFVKRGVSQFIVDVHKHKEPDLAAPGKSGEPGFVEREKVKSCAVLILRSGEMGEIVGLIFVNFRQPHNFSGEEKRAMDALATSAALAIRNARLHQADVKKQLEAIPAIFAAIAEKGPDSKQVLDSFLQQTLAQTGATYGVCMRWNQRTEVLESIARWPPRGDYPIEAHMIEEGVIGLAAKSRKSILVDDVADQNESIFVETLGEIFPAKVYKKVNPDTRCEIAVPLVDEGGLLGVLNIEHPAPHGLTQDHRVLLETLAVPAIIAFHTVDLYKRLERRIRHLSSLNLIASCVQEKSYEMDTLLRLFLTGITAGEGLGFSRAMLFLMDAEDGTLKGKLAIGPVSRQEAEKVWFRVESERWSSTPNLDPLLRKVEKSSEDTPLNIATRQLSFPIDHAVGAVTKCLQIGKPKKVDYKQPDSFRKVLAGLTEPNDVPQAFVCVPLIGKEKKGIGVLVVDNRFLRREEEVEEEDIAGLEAFAGLLALSIENVRLQDSIDEEKRRNWKEVTGFIAHTVGTVLFDVKGNVRNLRRHLSNVTAGEELGTLFDELDNGISRAERVLLEFRSFANPTPLKLEQMDLRRILGDVFDPVHGGCQVEMSLPSSLLVLADAVKLGHALREIRKNALEAMSDITDRPSLIKIRLRVNEDSSMRKRYVQIEIADNGPGIPDRVMGKIFKPGVTTKPDGTGLGLAMVKSVIDGHGGTIEASNSPDGGALYTVRIPMIAMREGVTQGALRD